MKFLIDVFALFLLLSAGMAIFIFDLFLLEEYPITGVFACLLTISFLTVTLNNGRFWNRFL
jgi:hypothetical protein